MQMQKTNVFIYFGLFAIISALLGLVVTQTICQAAEEKIWYVHDTIEPSLDEVRWVEEGGIDEAPGWISDGSWYHASMRQSLVGPSNIFVETYEFFNWTLVRQIAEYYYGATFDSFDSFVSYVSSQPDQWLYFSWQVDTEWYGVSFNTTKVRYSYNDTTSEAELWTYFHITRIPEYFAGEGKLENWLTGFDLTPVSTGSLTLWELHKEWGRSGVYYNLRFKAPANILSQHGDNYTATLPVSSYYQGNTFKIQQAIDINMPANTEVKETSPVSMAVSRANTASFVIPRGEKYPRAFTVLSGPPAKSFNQVIWENASLWVLTPGGWAAIATLIVLSWTAFRGRRFWTRSRLYHRMYNSMVTIYDLYSEDVLRFHQEMANVSTSIFKLLIEDKINDEQFEKLLVRRDDLFKRAHGDQTKSEK